MLINPDTLYHNPVATYLYLDDVSVFHCDTSIGIKEIKDESTVSLYPNPIGSGEMFNLAVPFQKDFNQIPLLKLMNLEGIEIETNYTATKTESEFIIQVSTANLSEGVYFISALIKDQKFTEKLIIIKNQK